MNNKTWTIKSNKLDNSAFVGISLTTVHEAFDDLTAHFETYFEDSFKMTDNCTGVFLDEQGGRIMKTYLNDDTVTIEVYGDPDVVAEIETLEWRWINFLVTSL